MDEERVLVRDRLSVDVALLLVRIIVGVTFAAHGAWLMFGAFGGPGWEKSVQMLGGGPLAYLVIIGEFFGGLGLIFGFLSRFSAAALIVIMIGAIVKVHWQNGFFLSFEDPHKNGFEFNLALIGMLIPVLLCGAGVFSIAWLLMPRSSKTGRPVVVLE